MNKELTFYMYLYISSETSFVSYDCEVVEHSSRLVRWYKFCAMDTKIVSTSLHSIDKKNQILTQVKGQLPCSLMALRFGATN